MSVSVIIAAHNSATTVGRAVRSALMQPETADVLLVDDASTDGTGMVARAAANSDRLTVIVLPENRGPAAARNIALERVSGRLVTVLDADDWMEEGRIGRLLAAAGADWDFAADDLLLAELGEEGQMRPMLDLAGPAQDIGLAGFISANLPSVRRFRRELGYLKPLMSLAFLVKHGLRYDPSLRLGEDFIFYVRALAKGARLRLVPACGYVAQQRPGSLSRRHSADDLFALAEADRALLAIPGLNGMEKQLLRRHRRLTLDKSFYRVALDAKARGEWFTVARAFAGTRSAALHIVRETLVAKLSRKDLPASGVEQRKQEGLVAWVIRNENRAASA